jgi:hypothetical protein
MLDVWCWVFSVCENTEIIFESWNDSNDLIQSHPFQTPQTAVVNIHIHFGIDSVNDTVFGELPKIPIVVW